MASTRMPIVGLCLLILASTAGALPCDKFLERWIEMSKGPEELRALVEPTARDDLVAALRAMPISEHIRLKWRLEVAGQLRIRLRSDPPINFAVIWDTKARLASTLTHVWNSLDRAQRLESGAWIFDNVEALARLDVRLLRDVAGLLGQPLRSEDVDRILGLKSRAVFEREAEIGRQGMQRFGAGIDTYGGGDAHEAFTMLTPYETLVALLMRARPKPDQEVVDIGAGLGRMGLTIHYKFPKLRFTGYEIVPERIAAAAHAAAALGISSNRLSFLAQDVAAPNFHLDHGDIFFAYATFPREVTRKLLDDLRALGLYKQIKLIAWGLLRAAAQRSEWLVESGTYRGLGSAVHDFGIFTSLPRCISRRPSGRIRALFTR